MIVGKTSGATPGFIGIEPQKGSLNKMHY